MESNLKSMLAVVISILLAISNVENWANAIPQVPCYFVFGDSGSDNGNNNNLLTKAKVNYLPYGIDFPEGPTGRFSNGRNHQDFIVKLLGFEQYIPPFAKLEGHNISNGVNYASGSAGIRDETGKHLGVCIPMNEQIQNHKTIISRIASSMTDNSTINLHLNKCIYSIQIGSNDYLNNYFQPATSEFYNTSEHYTVPEFSNMLVEQLSVQLKTLYDNGARKFVVYGMGMLGCTPFTFLNMTNGTCDGKLNGGATKFNERLKPLLEQLNKNLTDARFIHIDVGKVDVKSFVTAKPCCAIGGGGGELCDPKSTTKPCSSSNKHIFWDGVHITEAMNEMVAKAVYSGDPNQTSPINLQQLAIA